MTGKLPFVLQAVLQAEQVFPQDQFPFLEFLLGDLDAQFDSLKHMTLTHADCGAIRQRRKDTTFATPVSRTRVKLA